VLKHGLYNVWGTGVRVGLSILVIPALVRIMGTSQYGLWSLAFATVGFLALADGGLSVTVTVFLSKELARDDTDAAGKTVAIVLVASLALATVAGLMLYLGAFRVSDLFSALGRSEHQILARTLRVGSVLVWSQVLQSILIGVEQAYRRYGFANLLISLQSALTNLGMIPIAWHGGRVLALMEWQAIVALVILVAHGYLVSTLIWVFRHRMTLDKHKFVSVVRYTSLTWISNLGSVLFGRADRLLIGGMLGTSILGIYAAITSVTGQINAMSGAAVQPFLPSVSSLIAKGSAGNAELRGSVKQAFRANASLALGIGIILFVLASLVLRIIVPGGESPLNLLALRIAIIIYSLYSLSAVGYYTLFGAHALAVSTAIVLLSAVASLLLIGWGAHNSGLVGAVAGNVAYCGTLLLNVYGMKKVGVDGLWLTWLAFPAGWFVAGLVLGIAGPASLFWRALLLACHLVLLVLWFVRGNGNHDAFSRIGWSRS
jgi:O-antigen/teichoic acid export membrane protein